MNEPSNELVSKILKNCSELEEMANAIYRLQPVTHISQAKIQWVGGIPGAIKEFRENKRLCKLINEPIYQGKSFFQLAFHIVDQTDKIVEDLLALQGLIGKEDENYYGLVNHISNAVATAISAWYSYSPDMANAPITIGDQENVALYPSVTEWTKDALKKLNSPQKPEESREEKQQESSGCFGLLVIMILASTSIVGAIAYGVSLLV